MKAFMADFDQWFYIVLPHEFRYNSKDVALKQKVIGLVNFIFFHAKLGVLKKEFLDHILVPKSIAGSIIPNFSEIVSIIEVVRAVCKPYIEFKTADPTNKIAHDSPYFRQLVYKSAMFCLLLDKYGSFKMIDLKQSLVIFGNALNLMPGGTAFNGGGPALNDNLKMLANSDLRAIADALINYEFGGQLH